VASSKAGESAYVLLFTGTGEPRSIEGTDAKSLYFMPDGKRLLLEGAKLGEARVNCLLDLAGGPPRPVLPGVTPTAAISPDGRFVVAFDSNGKPGIYPLEGGTTRPIVGLESSEFIQRWSGDGRSLFVGRQGIPKRLYRLDPTSGTHDLLFELNPADPAGVSSLGEVYLTEDGRGYVYSYIRRLSDLYLAEGLK
jgi:hypothetical protein